MRLAWAILLLAASAAVADRPQFDWDEDPSNAGGLVRMDGKTLFEIREPAGGWQPVERAEIVAGRLDRLYKWIKPDNVRVGKMNNETVVELLAPKKGGRWGRAATMGNFLIVTVDEATAQDLHRTKWLLAHWWRDLFRDYLLVAQGHKPRATYKFSKAVRTYWDYSQENEYRGRETLRAMPGAPAAAIQQQYRNVPGGYAPAAPDIAPPK